MKRITIALPNAVATALEREARHRGVPVPQLAREAIETFLSRFASSRRSLPFVALGRSGHRTTARDIEAILEAEWERDTRPDGDGGDEVRDAATDVKLRSEMLRDFLDEWEREHGPLTAEELERAERDLGLRDPRG